MEYKLQTLPNKLRLLAVPMPSLESATVTVWVKTGSRNEPDKKLGLSHFLEHMAFKGGKKYPSAKAVSEAIDEVGGEFNASTSKEVTQYYIRIRSKLLERAFDVLSDIVLHPNLNQKEITKEKGVILEEMNMYEDTPVRRIWDLFEQLIFKGHSLGRDIIGTKETVPSLRRDDFVAYRDKYYHTGNMMISVAGGIDNELIKKLTAKYFAEVSTGNGKTKKNVLKDHKKSVALTTKRVEQAHMILGFPAEALGNNDRYKDAVLNTILGSGMSSRLFTEVREKRGLAYAVKSDIDRYADTGYFAVYAGTDPKNANEAIKVILDQLYGLANEKFRVTAKELEKAKEYLKGHLALGLEDTRGVNSFYGYEQLMLGKVRTPEEVYENVNKVTSDDIYASAKKLFDKKRLHLAIIGPYKNSTQFEKIIT
jgi:predicted Zn-dependent peptidase